MDNTILAGIAVSVLFGFSTFMIKHWFTKVNDQLAQLKSESQIHSTDLRLLTKDFEQLDDILGSIKVVRDEWVVFRVQLSDLISEMKNIKNSLEDVSVLKRDRNTSFQRIDEIRAKVDSYDKAVKVLRNRNHWLANKVTILKMHAHKAGWDLNKTDWQYPPFEEEAD